MLSRISGTLVFSGRLFAAVVLLAGLGGRSVSAETFVVDIYSGASAGGYDPGDEGDAILGDGVAEIETGSGITSLRSAIEEANALPGPDTIILGGKTHPRIDLPALSDTTGGTTIRTPNSEIIGRLGEINGSIIGARRTGISQAITSQFADLNTTPEPEGEEPFLTFDEARRVILPDDLGQWRFFDRRDFDYMDLNKDGRLTEEELEDFKPYEPGLRLTSENNSIEDLDIHAFPGEGIQVGPRGGSQLARSNTILRCRLGSEEGADVGNERSGVLVFGRATGTIIENSELSGNGGPAFRTEQVVDDEGTVLFEFDVPEQLGHGVEIDGAGTTGTIVRGNVIGISLIHPPPPTPEDPPPPPYMAPCPNGFSGVILANGASDNTIGGAGAGEGNIIGNNGDNTHNFPEHYGNGEQFLYGKGIAIYGIGTNSNRVYGNILGLNTMPQTPETSVDYGNKSDGIFISGSTENEIGAAIEGAGNFITFSGNNSLPITDNGILIGGSGTERNIIKGNEITGNDERGVTVAAGSVDNVIGGPEEFAGNVVSGSGTRGIMVSSDFFFGGNEPEGTIIQGNTVSSNSFSGINIAGGALDTLVGGPGFGEGNLVAGNVNSGIIVFQQASGNTVQGNLVRGNGVVGIFMDSGSSGNQIGGQVEGSGNTIWSNGNDGIRVSNFSTDNILEGNVIGVNPSGTPAGNGNNGVRILEGAFGNTVGGDVPEAANIITANASDGVEINGSNTEGNAILGNSIFGNIGLGIIHTFDGNDNIPAPTLVAIGPVRGTAAPNSLVEIFSSEDEEGEQLLDRVQAGPDGAYSSAVDVTEADGLNLTATATAASGTSGFALDSTSPFSEPLPITKPTITDEPDSLKVVEGEEFSLTILVEGTPDLSFGWEFAPEGSSEFVSLDDAPGFTGTDEATLVNPSARLGDTGTYRATVTNAVGEDVSTVATITVVPADLDTNAVSTLEDIVDGNTTSFAHLEASPGHDGAISLREILVAANATDGANFITFSEEIAGGTIVLDRALPTLSDTSGGTTIDGGGEITIDGGGLTGGVDGLRISSAENAIIGMNIVNMPDTGILISGSDATANTILGCTVGDTDGANAGHGLLLQGGAYGNLIGGGTVEEANVIVGNALAGIRVEGVGTSNNSIAGNFIGTTVGGVAVPNGANGVAIGDGASNNVVGGSESNLRNVISANAENGVHISGAGSTGNRVESNFIGASVTAQPILGNGGAGVLVNGGATQNIIGDGGGMGANLITDNANGGVRIVGAATFSNQVRQNSIYLNEGLGIDLVDTANQGIQAPVITGLEPLSGQAPPNTRVEFYIDTPTGGEGRNFVGAVNAGASGTFTTSLDTRPYQGQAITATATDVAGNTSEFAEPVVVDLDPPVITLTGDGEVRLECNVQTYEELGATATDDADGDISDRIEISVTRNGDAVPAVDATIAGTYLVAYDVSDNSGKAAETAVRKVIVEDTTVPVLILTGATTMTIECSGTFNDPGATATDVCGGDLTGAITTTTTVNTTVPGTYSVQYNVVDQAGNAAAPVSRTVTVVDSTAPALTLNGPATVAHTVLVPYVDAGAVASDACDGALEVTIDASDVNVSEAGTYTVTLSATDNAGNDVTATRTVNVVDNVAPVVTLIGASNVEVDCGGLFTDAGATAADNFDGDLTNRIVLTGSVNPNVVGTYVLRYDVRDAAGNAAAPAVRTVRVVDESAPLITVLGPVSVAIDCDSDYVDAGATADDGCEAT